MDPNPGVWSIPDVTIERTGPDKARRFIEKSSDKSELDGANDEHPKSIGLSDRPSCLAACRAEFTKGLGIDPTGAMTDVLKQLCHKIVSDNLSLWFSDLYCCDSKYCGVGLVGADLGQDREC
jgi:hypothetical protein